ncbi:hypothetical protein OUZ56_024468 [Daphnia magna]|uniref:Uncharacterized protein n=1 Tax=Daphnia magna TaxID=35525 RepID=A0ABR0B0U9_9CRUS|nr:hypothetical protein OUZ56_024468 [Daphnia magna]
MVSTSDSDSDNLSSNLETNQLLQRLTVSGKNLVSLLNTAPSEVRTHDLEIMRLARCLLRYRGMNDGVDSVEQGVDGSRRAAKATMVEHQQQSTGTRFIPSGFRHPDLLHNDFCYQRYW